MMTIDQATFQLNKRPRIDFFEPFEEEEFPLFPDEFLFEDIFEDLVESSSPLKSSEQQQDDEMISKVSKKLLSSTSTSLNRKSLEVCIKRLISSANEWSNLGEGGIYSTGIRCAILAMSYLERIEMDLSLSTLFSVAFIIGLKYSDDYQVLNQVWGDAVGLSLKETNKIELEMLQQLGWNCSISSEKYESLFTFLRE